MTDRNYTTPIAVTQNPTDVFAAINNEIRIVVGKNRRSRR